MKQDSRRLISYTLSFSLVVLPMFAALEKPETTVIKGKRGRHRFQRHFVSGPFRKASHKTYVSKGMYWIDGKPEWNKDGRGSKNWYGTDGGFPYSEFYSFQVTVDGRKWTVPPRLWADCYEPNLGAHPYTWTRLSPDGKRLAVGMYGSDGAGSYNVTWFLRADGRHSRTFPPLEQ